MSTQSTSSQSPVIKNASRPSSSGHSAQIYPQPTPNHQQRQAEQPQQQQPQQQQPVQSGGLLYNNLIPGHYRYGAAPPAPPVGPLSYSNISSQNSHQRHQQQHQVTNQGGDLRQNHHDAQQQSRQQHQYSNVPNSYTNISSTTTQPNTTTSDTVFLQVSEPDDDDFDDDLLVIASSDMMEEIDLDDETYYKPFRHLSGGSISSSSSVGNNHQNQRNSSSSKRKSKSSKPTMKSTESSANKETAKPMDLLAVLLSGPAAVNSNRDASTTDDNVDITILIQEASTKSSRARSMTNALVLQEKEHSQKTTTTTTNCAEEGVDNDLYVATANAHTEAAISFQILYKKLLGLKNDVDANQSIVGRLSSPSEELAKSMILLANGHARTAKSLGEMGVKWNMGKVDKSGRMVSKNSTNVNTAVNDKAPTNSSKGDGVAATASATEKKRSESESSNERLRMAVRGALEIVLEDDITNSTFLARSTVLNANKKLSAASSKVPQVHSTSTSNKKDRTKGKQNGENPVDDLMKLEKELRSMDMALEMGNSVASLGTAVASRPNNDLLGGSYMSSSSMWTSGIFGGRKPNAKQQQGVGAGVRSRANHLQHLSGGSGKSPAHALVSPSESKPSTQQQQQQQQGVQITPNASLDQSWWGGGGGQGSILASSAITTAATSHQRTQPTSGSNQANNSASTNAKQLMQLMDSLNRLGNENAQLMREVEKAKAARAEAEAAKQVMAQFKSDYNQRFNKVKEALEKYKHASGDNPVGNSAYVKSASAQELQKRDQMIKKLAADLRKERDESKKKDTALRKYEGFYREVKKRSAEKREQQQKLQQANAAANKK
ncbi:hypothetical protein QTG54_012142 [Skeletonema marinoi]|uniref:Uncharacterized protein n=1 Tax=Skeletonema marinoi TaxID=267567 RepID=A0AAD8Y1D9_9STRA|nr:hypothetical protein QTG54_012142 [Skeletonema marinoi]